MTNYEKLRALADWFDAADKGLCSHTNNNEVQRDLRAMANELEQLQQHNVMESLPDFKFTEWLGETYIRLNQVWVHRYSSQLHKENWKTTEELYELYLKQQGQ